MIFNLISSEIKVVEFLGSSEMFDKDFDLTNIFRESVNNEVSLGMSREECDQMVHLDFISSVSKSVISKVILDLDQIVSRQIGQSLGKLVFSTSRRSIEEDKVRLKSLKGQVVNFINSASCWNVNNLSMTSIKFNCWFSFFMENFKSMFHCFLCIITSMFNRS